MKQRRLCQWDDDEAVAALAGVDVVQMIVLLLMVGGMEAVVGVVLAGAPLAAVQR